MLFMDQLIFVTFVAFVGFAFGGPDVDLILPELPDTTNKTKDYWSTPEFGVEWAQSFIGTRGTYYYFEQHQQSHLSWRWKGPINATIASKVCQQAGDLVRYYGDMKLADFAEDHEERQRVSGWLAELRPKLPEKTFRRTNSNRPKLLPWIAGGPCTALDFDSGTEIKDVPECLQGKGSRSVLCMVPIDTLETPCAKHPVEGETWFRCDAASNGFVKCSSRRDRGALTQCPANNPCLCPKNLWSQANVKAVDGSARDMCGYQCLD